jgi:hypothetical protein
MDSSFFLGTLCINSCESFKKKIRKAEHNQNYKKPEC